MISIKNLERLQKLHRLIVNETTGTPKELATRLRVSERLIFCLLDELKDYEAKIAYDRKRKTYFYSDDFELDINISVSTIRAGVITSSFQL
ncbi:MAG: DNA-binding protein [Bacteroidota bacterium]